jgi:hypothetical protein
MLNVFKEEEEQRRAKLHIKTKVKLKDRETGRLMKLVIGTFL